PGRPRQPGRLRGGPGALGGWRRQLQVTPPAAAPSTVSGTTGPGAAAGGGYGSEISIDNTTIENGTVIYRAGGTEQKLDGLDAVVVMRSLKGPFTAVGGAKLAGLPAKFDLAID